MHTFKLKKGFVVKVSGVPVKLLQDVIIGTETDIVGGKLIPEESIGKVKYHVMLRTQGSGKKAPKKIPLK